MTIDTAALLTWGEAERRDLPWRRTRDGWAVLVSEFMLQQTQVARVVSRYPSFLERFPDPDACAAAPQSDVVRRWDGLGYNRRARHLHQCALAIVDNHGGRVPDDLAQLLELPGVGPYTARAVMVFAYEADVAPVDTNVARVLARWAGRTLDRADVQARADTAVPSGRAWAWTQALFDLGATICTKTTPDCVRCPVRSECAWAGQGDDPAIGSAGVGRGQSPFDGSDRQGRGRLVAAMRPAPVACSDVAHAAGWPGDAARARRVVEQLVDDGLVGEHEGRYHLA